MGFGDLAAIAAGPNLVVRPQRGRGYTGGRMYLSLHNASEAYDLIPLKPGHEGTVATLHHMARFVVRAAGDPGIRRQAEFIIRDCPGHDFQSEVCALFEWVRDKITYRKDPTGIERVSGPEGTLRYRVGDCDDKVVLLSSLLAVMGHEPRFAVISYGGRNWNHVYVEARVNGKWLALDPTEPRFEAGDEAAYARKMVYNLWPQPKSPGAQAPVSTTANGFNARGAQSRSQSGARRSGGRVGSGGLGAFVQSGSGQGGCDETINPYCYIDDTEWYGEASEFYAEEGIQQPGQQASGIPCAQAGVGGPCLPGGGPFGGVPQQTQGGISLASPCAPQPAGFVLIGGTPSTCVASALNPSTSSSAAALASLGISTAGVAADISGCGLTCWLLIAAAIYVVVS